jgi:hypothetical protein
MAAKRAQDLDGFHALGQLSVRLAALQTRAMATRPFDGDFRRTNDIRDCFRNLRDIALCQDLDNRADWHTLQFPRG